MTLPTNVHAFARLLRARQLAAMDACFPHVTFRDGTELTRTCIGLHLQAPEAWEIAQAAEQAERDGFDCVYVYAREAGHVGGY
jgi:hypothetical protein